MLRFGLIQGVLQLEASSSNRFRFLSCFSREHPVTATSSIESRTFTDLHYTHTRKLISFAANTTIRATGRGLRTTAVRFSAAIKTQRTFSHQASSHANGQRVTVRKHSISQAIKRFSILRLLVHES